MYKLCIVLVVLLQSPLSFSADGCLGAFAPKPEESASLKNLILDKDFVSNYSNMDGYIKLANKYFNGDMAKTYKNVSVLNGKEFKKLKWKPFKGSTKDFKDLEGLISDKKLMENYFNMSGYVYFADKYFNGDMTNAFLNVLAVSNKEKLLELNWRLVKGSTQDFEDLRNIMLDKKGDVFSRYYNMDGYVLLANERFDGDMIRTYKNASALLGKNKLKELNWQLVKGSTQAFKLLEYLLLYKNGKVAESYFDMYGYGQFADEFFKGDMRGAFNNISALLDKSKLKELNWHYFDGSTKDFEDLEGFVLDKDFFINYFSMNGYSSFANKHFDGDMERTYINVLAVLDKTEFKKLNWQFFRGSTKKFRDLENRILDRNRQVSDRYYEMDGYVLFSDKYFDGDMTKAFENVLAVLGGQTAMENLNWKKFEGDTAQYQSLIRIFEKTPLSLLKGVKSQKIIANKIFKGNAELTYRNVSYLRSKLLNDPEEFTELNWSVSGF